MVKESMMNNQLLLLEVQTEY